jgi:drug/metabolite transporter (DMT)-like permease
LLALSGTAIVILSRLDIGPAPILGFFCAFAGLAGIVGGSLWEKRFGVTQHPVTQNLIGYSAGFICLLPFLALEQGHQVQWTWPFIWSLGYLVIGNSVIAVGLLLAMIRAGEVSKVSTLLFLVPPLAALIAWLALGEIMPPLAWLGLVVAGVGVFVATRKVKK